MYVPSSKIWVPISLIAGAHAAPTANATHAPTVRDIKAFTMSDLYITLYDQPGCQGSIWVMQVEYGLNNHGSFNSYELSRGLRYEQLDFSTFNSKKTEGAGGIDAECAVWLNTVRPKDHSNGCFDVKGSACFRLWAY